MNKNRVNMGFYLKMFVIVVLFCGHVAMAQSIQTEIRATTTTSGATSEASALAGKIHAAILEPQTTGQLSKDNHHAIASMVESLLIEQLGQSAQLTLVDRQSLDKVLDEYQLQLLQQPAGKQQGVKSIAVDRLPPVMRQFWTAGVLIFTTIQSDARKKQQYVIDIQVVSAQSGQQVGQMTWAGQLQAENQKQKQDQPATTSLRQSLVQLAQDIPIQVKRLEGRPLVEVTAGQLVSDLNRLQWMVDQLSQSLAMDVEIDGRVALLQPRHAESTSQERLLRVMGLAKAGVNDQAAALRPVPDGRLTFILKEQFSPDIPFDKTPLTLTLNWHSHDAPARQTLTGTIGQWQTMQQSATAWATLQRHKLPDTRSNTSEGQDEQIARVMAVQELALMRQWVSLSFSNQDQEKQRRRRVTHHALRVAHLDPTNEEAAYTSALYCDALYNQSQEHESHAGLDLQNQVIAECQRYLIRFAETADKARVQEVRFKMALAAMFASRHAGPLRGLALSTRQNSELYRYANISVPIFMERDVTGAASSRYPKSSIYNLWTSTWPLRLELIMNCPDDELDAQYAYWREFWRTKIEPLDGDTPPWALMEVFFETRRGNWQKVRSAYSMLAQEYALSVKRVWRYGRTLLPPQTLRIAGDPDWSTWMPTFGDQAVEHISLNALGSHNWAPFIESLPSGPMLPTSKLIPSLPDGTRVHQPLHALTDAGGDLWLVTPWIDPTGGDANHELYFTPLPPETSEAGVPLKGSSFQRRALPLPATVQPIPWPLQHGQKVTPTILCVKSTMHQGSPTVLLGTRAHGLAIFEQQSQGQWQGRWITTREGLPANQIFSITSWEEDARPVWLIRGQSTSSKEKTSERHASKPYFVWTLDHNDTSHLLFQGSAQQLYQTAVKDPNKRALLASQITSIQLRRLVRQLPDQTSGKPFLAPNSQFALAHGRMWEIQNSTFTALSQDTLEPVAKPIGNSPLWPLLPFEPHLNNDKIKMQFYAGPFHMGKFQETTLDWPAPNVGQLVTWNDMLVMSIFHKSLHSDTEDLAFYQPAPPDSDDWAAQDNWSFFRVPEKATLKTLHVDSLHHLWLSTNAGLFRMNQQQLMLEGETGYEHCSFTTQAWRQYTRQHMAQNQWSRTVIAHILDKEYDQAKAVIQKTRALEPDMKLQASIHVFFRLQFEFLTARVQIEQGKLDDALATYDHIIAMDICTPPVELTVRLCQLVVLHRSQRWQDFLTLYETTSNRFVQLKDYDGPNDLGTLIKQARNALTKAKTVSPSKATTHE